MTNGFLVVIKNKTITQIFNLEDIAVNVLFRLVTSIPYVNFLG